MNTAISDKAAIGCSDISNQVIYFTGNGNGNGNGNGIGSVYAVWKSKEHKQKTENFHLDVTIKNCGNHRECETGSSY